MVARHAPPAQGQIMDAWRSNVTASPGTLDDESESTSDVVDLLTSERQYWQDPISATQREVWRPGDGDGVWGDDYFEKPGPVAPLKQRWRFYQSTTGPVRRGVNEPPKHVVLDDFSAFQILRSNLPRNVIVKYWSHDFGGSGVIRARRPHRGRGAIGDPDTEGVDRFHFTEVGIKKERYYFTGEVEYTPVVFLLSESPPPPPKVLKRKVTSPPPAQPRDPRKHGHNQFTPKDQLVRYGAPHGGETWKRYKPRINAFLRRDPSPKSSSTRYQLPERQTSRASSVVASNHALQDSASVAESQNANDNEESLWIEDDDPLATRKKRLRMQAMGTPFAPGPMLGANDLDGDNDVDDIEEDAQMFPFSYNNEASRRDSPILTTQSPGQLLRPRISNDHPELSEDPGIDTVSNHQAAPSEMTPVGSDKYQILPSIPATLIELPGLLCEVPNDMQKKDAQIAEQAATIATQKREIEDWQRLADGIMDANQAWMDFMGGSDMQSPEEVFAEMEGLRAKLETAREEVEFWKAKARSE